MVLACPKSALFVLYIQSIDQNSQKSKKKDRKKNRAKNPKNELKYSIWGKGDKIPSQSCPVEAQRSPKSTKNPAKSKNQKSKF